MSPIEEKVIELRKQGTPFKEIATQTDLKIDQVQYICKKNGIKLTKEQKDLINAKSHGDFTQEKKDKAIELRNQGISTPKICELLTINRNTLNGFFKKNKIHVNPEIAKENARQSLKEKYAKDHGLIISSYDKNKSLREIALELGMNKTRVSNVLIKSGVREKEKHEPVSDETCQKIIESRIKGFSLREIRNQTNLSISTIRYILNQNSIKLTKEQHVKNMREAMATLPPEIKECIISDRKIGMPIPKIAQKYNIPWASVKYHVQNVAQIKLSIEQAQENAYLAKLEINPNAMSDMRAEGAGRKSRGELEVANYIVSLLKEEELPEWYFQTKELSSRKILGNGQELDSYVPSKNFALEYNGLFTHSAAPFELRESLKNKKYDPNYHRNKFLKCFELGINLFSVFEDEWENKQNIVKNMIKWRLGKFEGEKLRASDLELVKLYKNNEFASFFETNHLDGNSLASFAYALVKDGKIVACASVRTNRKKQKEIARLATDFNFSIHGGAARLIKNIKNDINEPLISMSNNRFSTGQVYKKIGFEFLHSLKPSYFYTNFKVRIKRERCQRINHPDVITKYPSEREQARAGVFSQIHLGNNKPLYEIHDCGHMAWILK
jgi:orotate phosphoribosyltransferase-like protein/N-acetylglutamate synthase-like GNAT family acetyltransferase